jgi:hypothetical protein
VVVVIKPDRTTLVHDADGYQPAAWLTRPDSLTVEADADAFGVTARTDEQRLRVVSHAVAGRATFPVSPAGVPVGHHPDTGGALVRTGGAVVDLGSDRRYPLVAGATVLEESCDDCGLPLMAVERGAAFEVCLDRDCDPLDDAVRDRFDRAWACPDCGSDLPSAVAAACSPAVTPTPTVRRPSRSRRAWSWGSGSEGRPRDSSAGSGARPGATRASARWPSAWWSSASSAASRS